MTLHRKTIVIVGATLIALIAVLYLVSSKVLLGGVLSTEQNDVLQDLHRISTAVSDALSTMDVVTRDFASMDNIRHSLESRNRNYFGTKISNQSLLDLKVGYLLLTDRHGHMIYSRGFDRVKKRTCPVPGELCTFAQELYLSKRLGSVHRSVTGIITFPDRSAFVSARPVLAEGRRHRILGMVLMARDLDAHTISRLSKLTQMHLDLSRSNEFEHNMTTSNMLLNTQQYGMYQLGENKLFGYARFNDLMGKPAIAIGSVFNRDIYNRSKASMHYVLLVSILTALIFMALVMLIIDRLVLRRLGRLNSDVNEIGLSGDLSARVSSIPGNDELTALAGAINRTLAALDLSQKKLVKTNRELEQRIHKHKLMRNAYIREHRIAEVLQHALMPDVLVSPPGYGIAGLYKPALKEAEIGGDFYDVFTLGDGRVALVMGDISGRGLPAAIHTAMAKYMIRAYAHFDPDPALVMERLNKAMCEYTPDELFVTVFYGVLDPEKHTLVYANGGHDQPIHYSGMTNKTVSLDPTGRIVGILNEGEYECKTLRFGPGDHLLLYTDGISDAGCDGKYLTTEGLHAVLLECLGSTPSEIAHAVLKAAVNASGDNLRDDAAVLVVTAEN